MLAEADDERVAGARIGWLTTLRRDGSPHTTPVWFVFDGSAFSVASALTNLKVRNVRLDPRVSLAIDGSGDSPLVAQGSAEVVDMVKVSPAVTEAFARKYGGWVIQDETVDGERAVIEIRVSRWLLGG